MCDCHRCVLLSMMEMEGLDRASAVAFVFVAFAAVGRATGAQQVDSGLVLEREEETKETVDGGKF